MPFIPLWHDKCRVRQDYRIKTNKYTDVYAADIDRYNSQANFLTNF